MMSYALGIDIGSTSTAAGITGLPGDDENDVLPTALHLSRAGAAMPAAVFVRDDASLAFGDDAVELGAREPERLIQDVARRVGDEIPFVIGDVDVWADDLYAAIVEWVTARATELHETPPASVAVTHPATWGAYRRGCVLRALHDRGIRNVHLVTSAEAALVLDEVERAAAPRGGAATMVVFDLGGESLEVGMYRRARDGEITTLGTPQSVSGVGGNAIDDAVVRHVDGHVPGGIGDLGSGPRSALLALGHLRRESRTAKELLSTQTAVSIPLRSPDRISSVRLVRAEFEAMIEPCITEALDAMRRVIAGSGIESDDLDAIVLVGGASQSPLIAQRLSAEFERPILTSDTPDVAVSLGAARAVAHIVVSSMEADERVETAPSLGVTPAADTAASRAHVASKPLPDIDAIISGSVEASPRASGEEGSRSTAAHRGWFHRRGIRAAMVSAAVAAAIIAIMPVVPLGASVGPPTPRAFAQTSTDSQRGPASVNPAPAHPGESNGAPGVDTDGTPGSNGTDPVLPAAPGSGEADAGATGGAEEPAPNGDGSNGNGTSSDAVSDGDAGGDGASSDGTTGGEHAPADEATAAVTSTDDAATSTGGVNQPVVPFAEGDEPAPTGETSPPGSGTGTRAAMLS